jgi:GYF domain 2
MGVTGWFYKQNGERVGPISQLELRELVTSGQIQPRQAVWQQTTQDLFFVCAAAVAFDAENEALKR